MGRRPSNLSRGAGSTCPSSPGHRGAEAHRMPGLRFFLLPFCCQSAKKEGGQRKGKQLRGLTYCEECVPRQKTNPGDTRRHLKGGQTFMSPDNYRRGLNAKALPESEPSEMHTDSGADTLGRSNAHSGSFLEAVTF